jgi:hypothetical protein
MSDSDSDGGPEIGTIAALAGDVSSDDEEDVTPPMPVLFLSHGGGPCIHTSVADAPQFEGIDKVLWCLLTYYQSNHLKMKTRSRLRT